MTEISLPAPVIATRHLDQDSGTDDVLLRLYHIPTALVTTGGVRIYRATTRTGFSGTLATDYVLVATVSLPASGTAYTDFTLSAQPTGENLYYRGQTIDQATPTMASPWGNVAWFVHRKGATQPVPTTPSDLRPGRGHLRGVVDTLQATTDLDAGYTWYEFAKQSTRVADSLFEELLGPLGSESAVARLFADPPPALADAFEARATAQLAPLTTMHHEDVERVVDRMERLAAKKMRELLSSQTAHLPGSAPVRLPRARLVR